MFSVQMIDGLRSLAPPTSTFPYTLRARTWGIMCARAHAFEGRSPFSVWPAKLHCYLLFSALELEACSCGVLKAKQDNFLLHEGQR